MTSPLNAIPFPTRLEQLKSAARESKQAFENAWVVHYKDAMTLKDSNTWQADGLTWEQFCKDNPDVLYAASSYRVQRMSVPYAEILQDATGIQANERTMREQVKALKAIVPDEDKALLLPVYEAAVENTLQASGLPTQSEIQAAYEVLLEEKQTGMVEFSDTVAMVTPETRKAAIQERIIDVANRHRDYKAGNQAPKKKLTTVIQGAMVEGRYRAVLGEEIPAFLIGKTVTLYISEDES